MNRAALASMFFVMFSVREAHASGYLTARFGSDHGSPAAPNPYAVYFNPAAIGGIEGTQIVGDLSLGVRSVTYDRGNDALSPSSPSLANDPQYVAANTGRAKLLNVVPLPYLGAASDLGTKNLRVGYALYVPFGGMADWHKRTATDYAPGAYDGPQH
jgi:long-chain fatty acid transport protein